MRNKGEESERYSHYVIVLGLSVIKKEMENVFLLLVTYTYSYPLLYSVFFFRSQLLIKFCKNFAYSLCGRRQKERKFQSKRIEEYFVVCVAALTAEKMALEMSNADPVWNRKKRYDWAFQSQWSRHKWRFIEWRHNSIVQSMDFHERTEQ